MNAEIVQIAAAAVRLYAEMHPRPLHVTQQEAAALLDTSTHTVRAMIRSGDIKLNKLGRIPISEVDRVLAAA